MKTYRVELKCWGWMIRTIIVEAPNPIAAEHTAKGLYLKHAQDTGETDLRAELWSCEEVAA